MQYHVKHYTFDEVEMEKTLFSSYIEDDCWAFVRNHLTCNNAAVRDNAKYYVVMDSLKRVYSPSMDVVLLKKFNNMKAA